MLLCGDTRQHSRHHSYPLLSPTFRSHQLWTPLHLDRVTINDRKYQHYLKTSPVNPSHRLLCGGKKYGDDGFFLHKNIPIGQQYSKTLLLRSDVRPWDQTVPRPLTTGQILEKESDLLFPSQHPFTSHISQFAVFPDSKMSTYVPPSSQLVLVQAGESTNGQTASSNTEECQVNGTHETVKVADAYIQTDVTCFDQCTPPQFPKSLLKERTPINTVKRKAYSDGVRLEVVNTGSASGEGTKNTEKYQEPMPRLCLHPGIYRWDVSRKFAKAKGLVKSSMTYPIPSTMYSPMEHPLTVSSYLGTTDTQTFEELNSVNKRVSTSTAYTDNYSLSVGQSRQIFKRESQSAVKSHPALTDSRGKYARITQFSAVHKTEQDLQNRTQAATQTDDTDDEVEDKNEEVENKEDERSNQDNIPTMSFATMHHRMPSATHSIDRESYLQPSSRGSYTCGDGYDDCYHHHRDCSNTSYSKSNTMKSFHMKYSRREMPDLRQYSMSSGRRHIINGYHAYYWH